MSEIEYKEETVEIEEGDFETLTEQTLDTTSLTNGHLHTYLVDEEGTGETIKTFYFDVVGHKHTHRIVNYEVRYTEGHKHNIQYGSEETKDKIKEIRFTLNNGDSVSSTYITKKIKGELLCVIIDTVEQTNVRLSLDETEIVLWSKQGFVGPKYLALRTDAVFSNDEHSQSPVCWTLNDKIKIEVEGRIGAQTTFTIRWK